MVLSKFPGQQHWLQNTGVGRKCTEEGEDKKPPFQPAPVHQADSALPMAPKKPPTVTINGIPAILVIGTGSGKPCYIDHITHKHGEFNICFLTVCSSQLFQ